MVEFRVDGDGCVQIAAGVDPERFASPNQSFDREAIEHLILAVYADRVLPTRLDLHAAGRKRRELGWRAMRRPIAHHQHLHGGGSIASNCEKLLWPYSFSPFVA